MNVKVGDRIRLVSMTNDPDPIPEGDLGTVRSVVSLGSGAYKNCIQVDVDWDSGRTLACVLPVDKIEILAAENESDRETLGA